MPDTISQSVPLDRIFYDGNCGLCHWAVQFVVARDKNGEAFRFAPLDSDAFRAVVPPDVRAQITETMAVVTHDGQVLTRSAAAIHLAKRLGGFWRIVATLAWAIPTPVRDWLYGWIARNRHHIFAKPTNACPIVPPELRSRFEA